ncbi:MAG TPA: BCAM0308 family protein [Vicinamibacteria bacterium]|nr:BCAM0308 family protein [Vicinamibacteria bacterium]
MRDTSTTPGKSRRDRRLQELVHDTYKSKRKLPEPTVCPECFAVYHDGRWQWREKPADAHEERCPACARTHDKYPAGQVTVTGPFLKEHRDEILNLAWNQEKKARGEHPLDRIMGIDEEEGMIVIKTTDIHLPRAIGEALHRAYEGELDYRYNEEEYYLDVSWER